MNAIATPAGLICVLDEAGRGPLAGPVFAAAVVLDPKRPIEGLADSKTIGVLRRNRLAREIRERALTWAVASASVAEIDALNILQASLLAMQRAFHALGIRPERALVDGLHCPLLPCPAQAVVRGDASIAQIAAASILAKTDRDAEMVRLHALHPRYGFDRHKGYPTPAHVAALREYGACEQHRRSFAPVRAVLDRGRLSCER